MSSAMLTVPALNAPARSGLRRPLRMTTTHAHPAPWPQPLPEPSPTMMASHFSMRRAAATSWMVPLMRSAPVPASCRSAAAALGGRPSAVVHLSGARRDEGVELFESLFTFGDLPRELVGQVLGRAEQLGDQLALAV